MINQKKCDHFFLEQLFALLFYGSFVCKLKWIVALSSFKTEVVMATRRIKFLWILVLIVFSLACVVPIVGDVGRNFISNLVDLEDRITVTPHGENPAPVVYPTITHDFASAAGVYKGTSNISDIWLDSFGGKVYLNNFEITIGKNGSITGILESAWETENSQPMSWEPSPGAPIKYCVTRMSNIDQGTVTGNLLAPKDKQSSISGLIELNMSAKKQIFRSDCPEDYEEIQNYFKLYIEIVISGDQLTGTVKDGSGDYALTVIATKQ